MRGSHLRAAVVDLVGVDPVAVDNDAAELLGRAAHALSVDEGRELAGERLRSALVKVSSLRRAVSSFASGPARAPLTRAGRGKDGTHLGHILDPADQPRHLAERNEGSQRGLL